MHRRILRSALFLVSLLYVLPVVQAADVSFEVTLDSKARREPATGRLIVHLVREGSRVWERQPAEGPFWQDPQPLFGMDVEALAPGAHVVIGPDTTFPHAFPHPPRELKPGKYRAQAVLDTQRTESVWRREPGNLFGDPVEFEVRADEPVVVELTLTRATEGFAFPRHEMLREVTVKSRLLSDFQKRPVSLKAGVLLPIDYDPQKQYAAVYEVPGFSGRHDEVAGHLRHTRADWGELRKRAFVITLDPESPNGHTLFCDSRVNGPAGQALIEELIPEIERQFPLIREPWARIVTGHSSGGWSALWLGTTYPDTFGACWSTGPDPVDFRRFELIDIYAHENAYVADDGAERPAARYPYGENRSMVVTMSVREENGGEGVLGPNNTSGQQWDSWMACWGTPDPNRPEVAKPLFDAGTGAIDREEAKSYEAYDIRLLLSRHPDKYGPIFAKNIRLICGEQDNFYLNEAVALLKEELEKHDLPDGPGYVKLVPSADHGGSLMMSAPMRAVPGEMVGHLKAHDRGR